MKKILLCSLMLLLFLTGCNKKEVEKPKTNNNEVTKEEMVKEMKATIDGREYTIILEDNATTKKLAKLAPFEITMEELNGNEKYYYLSDNLPVDSYNPNYIEKGDVMLYGSNCIVIFYKSFDTPYSYTKIGHIDNLPDLGNKDIIVKFEK